MKVVQKFQNENFQASNKKQQKRSMGVGEISFKDFTMPVDIFREIETKQF